MRKTILAVALALVALAAWALPTLEQVQDEVRLGHLSNAESMMHEVVTQRPGSARAHYVYAEVLARNGKFAEATEQARLARQSDPQITFTDPAKFTAFEQLLARESRSAVGRGSSAGAMPAVPAPRAPAPATSAGGLPGWAWGALLAVAALMLWRGFSRSRAAAAGAGMAGTGMANPSANAGVNPGVPPAYSPYGPNGAYGPAGVPGARSGMMGTGLAAAGGFAAGMLADELMHRHRDGTTPGALDNLGPSGAVPEFSDPAAMELESRPVDFGSGADWGDGGGAADAGSFDIGGGSDWS